MGGVLQKRRQTFGPCKALKRLNVRTRLQLNLIFQQILVEVWSVRRSKTHRSKTVSGAKCRDSPVTFTWQTQAISFIARRNRHWREQVWPWKSPAITPWTGLDERSQFNSVLWNTASLTARSFSRFTSVYRLILFCFLCPLWTSVLIRIKKYLNLATH